MLESLTFRITLPDGTFVDEEVSFDFSGTPLDRQAEILREANLQDTLDITARLLQEKLETEVPLEAIRTLLTSLQAGKGVTLGTSS